MNRRGKWQGMLTIARLNWPFYVAAAVIMVGAIAIFAVVPMFWIRTACALAVAGCLWFLVGSLAVSHLVYDRSDLYRWHWTGQALAGVKPERIVFCHAGFDEASAALRQHLQAERWTTLDHFDAARMTEPSIRRARHLFPPTEDTKAAPFDHWPLERSSIDVVFALLAIHEFRLEAERTAWFSEARRCLSEGGRVVLLEHTRDLANFVAFGPGFLHFHSPASWRRCWMRAGLTLHAEFRVTPWVRAWILSKG
jgi:SAM-dependent methyltransferase